MSLVLGLTGSIASGKSAVAELIRQYNIPIVDADLISRAIITPGKEAYFDIIESFGEEILNQDQTINRKKLGALVFNDENKRNQLNNIMHPVIEKEIIKKRNDYVAKNEKYIVLDIPLLYENNLTHLVDKTIVVSVDEDTQIRRLMKRDQSTAEEAKKRIKTQIPISQKAKWADIVIDNNGTLQAACVQLEKVLKELLII